MNKTQETESVSPLSDFKELIDLDLSNRPDLVEPRVKFNIFSDLWSYILPNPLTPNCLLTRYPLVFLKGLGLSMIERLSLWWLVRKLKAHGYDAHLKDLNDLNSTEPIHLFLTKDDFNLIESKLGSSGVQSFSLILISDKGRDTNKRQWTDSLMLQWRQPSQTLSSALRICNSLAERDFQCCDK